MSSSATESNVDERKAKILDNTVLSVVNGIRSVFALTRGVQSHAPRSDGYGGTSTGMSDGRPDGISMSSQAGKKRKLFDNDADDNEGDDVSKEKGKEAADASEQEGLKYACPYLKFNPARYKSERNCLGPGWRSIHRLK
jgi:hypothetical protein